MPIYSQPTTMEKYRLGFSEATEVQPPYDPQDWQDAWNIECTKPTSDVIAATQLRWYCYGADPTVNISRQILFFDTTSLSPSTKIFCAGLWIEIGLASWGGGSPWGGDWLYVFSCPDVSRPAITTDYGYLGGLNTIVASYYIPGRTECPPDGLPRAARYLTLNQAGRDAIVPGGMTPFGFRAGHDFTHICPPKWYSWGCFLDLIMSPKLYVNEDPLLAGYIWTNHIYLYYLDSERIKRRITGDVVSSSPTTECIWVDGNYLHYVDSWGTDRRILASLTGNNINKPDGQLSINDRYPTKLCYIDGSGSERSIEGIVAP